MGAGFKNTYVQPATFQRCAVLKVIFLSSSFTLLSSFLSPLNPHFLLSADAVCQLGGMVLHHADVIYTSACQRTAIESRRAADPWHADRIGIATHAWVSAFMQHIPGEEEYGWRPTLVMCVGVKRRGVGNAARLGGTGHGLADKTLKRSGRRVNWSWLEIRKKATSERARGVCERQSMK